MEYCDDDTFWKVYKYVGKELKIRRFPYLYLDYQPCNMKIFNNVIVMMAGKLCLPKQIVVQKLLDSKFLTVENNALCYCGNIEALSVGNVIERIFV